MNIEVGKYYVRGDGQIVRVDVYDPQEGTDLSYHCSDSFWRAADGRTNMDTIDSRCFDLVREDA